MNRVQAEIKETNEIPKDQLIDLYRRNKWSSADKPDLLYKALLNSHTLVSAWIDSRLVGIANTLSDGHMVVYYSHMLVHPDFQGQGIGSQMLSYLKARYHGFHQQILVADKDSIAFYLKHGFVRAGATESMWIYEGNEH